MSSTGPPLGEKKCEKTFAFYTAVVFLVIGLGFFIISGILIFVMRNEGEDIDTIIYIGFIVGLVLIGSCSYGIYIEEKKRKEKCKN